MKQHLMSAALVLLVPSLAAAHVSVRPRESRPGAQERYTVRVPTEGTVATTHVALEIPADVSVIEVLPSEGATFETAKQGTRITSITWKKEIPPKAAAEFTFLARNPGSGDIVWKAHQHFIDGTVADWVGPAGDRRPAAVTKLPPQAAAAAQTTGGDAAVRKSAKNAQNTRLTTDPEALTAVFHSADLIAGCVWVADGCASSRRSTPRKREASGSQCA